MKSLVFALMLCVVAAPAFADLELLPHRHHAAPAPLIGAGIPVALAMGGVLLGAKFLKRRK